MVGGAEEGGAGWGGVPAHGVAARAYSTPSNAVHCLRETGGPGGVGVLCMLLASWRPVSNIPGTASRSTMRAVTLASVAMLTPRKSAKATDQSPVFLESLFHQRAAGLGIPLRIPPPLYHRSRRYTHGSERVHSHFLICFAQQNRQDRDTEAVRRGCVLAQGHPWCRAGLGSASWPRGVTSSSFRCLAPQELSSGVGHEASPYYLLGPCSPDWSNAILWRLRSCPQSVLPEA